ncbi:MAG: hypothetical protein Q9171_004812 [Xanthocarpia ochracea]
MDAAGNIGRFIPLDENLNRNALLNLVVGYLSKDSYMFVRWTVKRIKARIDDKMYSSTGRSRNGPIDFLNIFLDAARSDGNMLNDIASQGANQAVETITDLAASPSPSPTSAPL